MIRAAIVFALCLCATAVGAGASLVLHSSGECKLYLVTSNGSVHVGCTGDPTMPKGDK